MSNKVIDTQVLKQTGSLQASLRDAKNFSSKDIGKTFVPPLNARLNIKAPQIPLRTFMALKAFHGDKPLPANFNWADKPFINPVQDQGSCGSCWAVSSASAIGDQWSIAVKAKKPIMLAALGLANCIPDNNCTNGGMPSEAGEYAVKAGIVADADWPYSCGGCEDATQGNIPEKCISGQGRRFFTKAGSVASAVVLQPNVQGGRASKIEDVNIPATLDLIKTAVMNYGPMVTGFAVPTSGFMDMPKDSNYIFQPSGSTEGGHAVVITGWGTDPQGKLYWIIRNSWSPAWGDKGYFRVYAYPLNHCGFDIPLFDMARIRQINQSIKMQLPFHLQASFSEPNEKGGWGGVTIWQIDTERSPKVAEMGYAMSSGDDSKKKWIMYIAIGIGVVVVVALIAALLKSRNKAKALRPMEYDM
jgi:hypothetical protein